MFIEVPNLPSGRVTHVIVDKRAPEEFLNNIEKLKIKITLTIEAPVGSSVCTHPDMQIYHQGGNKVVCEPSVFKYYNEKLSPEGFEVICGKTALSSNYPLDIAYNVSRVGNYAIHNKTHTDSEILKYLYKNNVSIINVSQGYTKCAMCIVNENAVITSDHGISKALEPYGIDVLKIKEGGIVLEGMEYGFIGGTCGLVSPETMIFCGNIEKHTDYKKIRAFTEKHGVGIVSFCSGILKDIGSVILLSQSFF